MMMSKLRTVVYEYLSVDDETTGSESIVNNISTTVSEVEVGMLPAIPINS